MRRVGFLALLVAWGLVAAGCGIKSTVALPFPAHAVDARGTAITIAADPTRIVSSDPGATAILRDLGLGDRVVAVAAADVEREAADPTTALVVVPLASAEFDAATTVVYRYGSADLAGAPSAIVQLGLAVGRGPEAARIADRVAAELQAVATRVSEQGSVRTLIEGPGFSALGPGSPLGQAVAAAGGANVVSTDTVLNPTTVLGLDVQAWVSAQPGGSTYATLSGISELRAVPAIRDARVVPVPLAGFPIDAALPRALQALADDLHAAAIATE